MLRELDFAGGVVVVTGGGGGIGQACAATLAELGAAVAVIGRTAAKLEETQALIAAQGGACETYVADVTSEADVARVRDAIAARHGRVKAVINNAGDNFRSKITDLSTEDDFSVLGRNAISVLGAGGGGADACGIENVF